MKFPLLPVVILGLLNGAAGRYYRSPYPSPASLNLRADEAVQAGTLVSLGMRRLAADLATIELLIYYGTSQASGEEDDGPIAVPANRNTYPSMMARVRQILDLDPFFTYPSLYGAGVLAFNLNRPEEGLEILKIALERDPNHAWEYRTYIAAIGAKRQGNAQAVIDALTPALNDPDCPTIVEHILAFLNRRLGHRDEAIRIYRRMLNSRDAAYVQIARDELRRMGAKESP